MSLGKTKFRQGDDTDNSPLYQQVLKTSKQNIEASRRATYESLLALGLEDKVARAASLYYVVE